MSITEARIPECKTCSGAVALRIEAKDKDLGGITVRRVLPAPKQRAVGPFVFFDHMGPATFPPGKGIAVWPHPHIGLATVTYLFDGEIMHRDSLGIVQPIRAGAVNLMTAGRGIVHSERAGDDLDETSTLHGIQSWMALPEDSEEIEPAFSHYPSSELPEHEIDGVTVRVILGAAYGHESPVTRYSPILYLECRMPAGSSLELPDGEKELAVYVVNGEVTIGEEAFGSGSMAVIGDGGSGRLRAGRDSRVMVIGGEPLGHRTVWWNFVSSSRERIEKAKEDWRNGRFGRVPGDDEFMPLPE